MADSTGSGETEHHFPREGLIAIFNKNVSAYPNHPAIITSQDVITYHELAQQALALAEHLQQKGVREEMPVGILMEPGIEQIICQLAIIGAGGSCVPLDPTMPDDRINFMLADVHATLIISNETYRHRALCSPVLVLEPALLQLSGIAHSVTTATGSTHRSHILFTSGTTGRPKAVEIEAKGIIRLTANPHYIELRQTDRISCSSNPTFDASLFEIWAALLNGATLVIISKKTIIDPYELEEAIRHFSIDIMFLTTALFHLVASIRPHAFRVLRYLVVGGETLNPFFLRQVLDAGGPQRFINGYGPTEGTTFTLTHELSHQDAMGENIPLGKPIDQTQAFILDDKFQPVPTGKMGRIYISGAGLARGYYQRSELNRERFITVDVFNDNQPLRLYDTGDSGWQRDDGVFMFAGRTDNQIKIRGHRIEIEEIEAQLLESQLLQSAAVCVIRTDNTEPYLVAFVVPNQPDDNILAEVKTWLAKKLPEYMRPRLSLVDSLPFTFNGKMDRAKLVADFARSSIKPLSSPLCVGDIDLEMMVLETWRRVLDDPAVTIDDDFFQSGGNSLQAARLIVEIGRQTGQRLSVQNLYDAPTPQSLIKLLERSDHKQEDITAVLLNDGKLPDDIWPLPSSSPADIASPPQAGNVLLTGATGFLGAFLLRDLLLKPDVRRIICLVRARDIQHALIRVKSNLQQYGLWQEDFHSRLEAVASDLAKPLLALDVPLYERISRECDVIFHLAAHVNYIQPYSAHYSGNITATENILRFAVNKKAKPLHYVSTIAIFGPAGLLSRRTRIYENDDILPYLAGLKYDSGYSQSQWVVERIIWQARDRGIPLAVYRPGFIMGDSASGAGNPKDFVGRLIKGCIQIGAYPQLPNQRKEFIPVDYVSRILLNLALGENNLGKAFHLVPPDSTQSTDLASFFELINLNGFNLQPVSYPQWISSLESDVNLASNPLMPLVPMLSEAVYGELTRWQVYENMPAYDAQNAQNGQIKSQPPLSVPVMEARLLGRYLDYWRRTGYLA
ncbi:non-ribosomal peptide synthetase [Serratia fonticola]|uniref:non-ribosomal peptide synthetase n=1 Tax=Serratia fonticola TaxID=47917 RepID=UPI0021AE258E|nr:amino acid adenylation domain-containing protein [Serratia fonticola]